jgi:hypothetical protein
MMKKFPRPQREDRGLAFQYHHFIHRSRLRASLFAYTGIWI